MNTPKVTQISLRQIRVWVLLVLLTMTVGCDQVTKQVARAKLSYSDGIPLPSGLGELRLAENPGSFLSLGASMPPVVRSGLLTVGVAAILLWLFLHLARKTRLDWPSFLGLALIWAGGAGNLIDRVTRHGLVTDFLWLRLGRFHTGIFNFADVMVMLGIFVLAGSTFVPRKRSQENDRPETDDG